MGIVQRMKVGARTFAGVTDLLDRLEIIGRFIASTHDRLSRLERRKAVTPFVAVLVRARKDGIPSPVTLGDARELDGDWTVQLQSNVPLHDVEVIVFCDLRKVRVQGIYLGVELQTMGLGSCPIARFELWQPAVWLRVHCVPVEDATASR
jgi:hypothetical protein